MSIEKFVQRETESGLKLLGWGDVLKPHYETELEVEIYGEDHRRLDWEQRIPIFRAWCEQHNVHYYAAEKESFFWFVGIEEAEEAGAEYLLAENLS